MNAGIDNGCHPLFHSDCLPMTLSKLHRHLALLLITLWTGVCLALPAPHEIEQAVANGQLPQAERMLREVIAEKPRSARAHYELAQVLSREGQHTEALQAIRAARELDPALKFAQSPEKFNAVAHAIEQQARPASTRAAAPSALPAPAPTPAQPTWLWPALLSAGFALLVLALWRRMQARPTLQPATFGASMPQAPRGFGAEYDPRGPASGYGYGNPYPASAPTAGSGVAGAVVGGLAGVAAGYALSKALESHDHPASAASTATPRPADPMEDVGLVRMDSPGSGNDLGSFDAGGGGDDWGDASSDSDSW